MQSLEFRAMGCQMLVAIDSNRSDVLQIVPAWFVEWESIFSRFKSDSELSRLNHSAGKVFECSETLWALLNLAVQAEDFSSGLVSPAVLPALLAAGYEKSFASGLVVDAAADANMMLVKRTNVCLSNVLEFNSESKAVCLSPAYCLDFGGFVKGWCADQVAQRLGSQAPVLMDAGGDIAVSGAMSDGQAWVIGVANPFCPDENLCDIQVNQSGVATSGRDYRHWVRNGEMQHHIIDPRTAKPAVTDAISATVIAPSASQAEVAAKVVMILGVKEGLAWIRDKTSYAACVVDEEKNLHMNKEFEAFLVR